MVRKPIPASASTDFLALGRTSAVQISLVVLLDELKTQGFFC
jgi:hypothetical protein